MSLTREQFTEDDFLLRHPFTCVIAGPSGSGKTILTRDIIENFTKTTTLRKRVANVIWVHGQSQQIHSKPLPTYINIEYRETLPTNDQIIEFQTDFIVVDDMMSELGDSKRLSEMFTKLSHHLSFSLIFIVQNMFHKAKEMRNISTNAHYVFLMKTRRDVKQVEHFGRQAFPHSPKQFVKMYVKATEKPFSYLLIDNTQKAPDRYRQRFDILHDFPAAFEEQ